MTHVWIDFSNAPHVLFFKPILTILQERGHKVSVTFREFSSTPQLAKSQGIEGIIIGKHGGKWLLSKGVNVVWRTILLFVFCFRKKIDIALSHNSYPQTIAGRVAGIRVITFMDYEGQPANHIAFRFANLVVVPTCFPDLSLRKFGAGIKKVVKYDGFKEQIYLSNFTPDTLFDKKLSDACGVSEDTFKRGLPVLTLRTPATMATYHTFKNPLFDKILQCLNEKSDVISILLPRYGEQKKSMAMKYPHLLIPRYQISGSDLVYFSDIVISAGGTMNREAAILGTPVYTIFAGILPAVDERLISIGRMCQITSMADFLDIKIQKKRGLGVLENEGLIEKVCNLIDSK